MNRLLAAPVVIGALLLAAAGGLGWIWMRSGRPEPIDPWLLAVLFLPLALLGAAVLSRGTDRAQIAITVWVVVMFGGLLPLWLAWRGVAAASPGVAQWPLGVACGVSWAALLVGFMLWLAPWAATVPAPSHILAVAPQTLRNRLLALPTIAPGLQAEPGERPDELSIVYDFRAGKRQVRMRLRLGAQRVFAKEYSGVRGDAPITDGEARIGFMRPRIGEGVRPSAAVVYASDWNVTMPSEDKRRALGVRVLGDSVQLPSRTIASFAHDAPAGATQLPHLLTEIVHQSGWQWRGVFRFED